MVDDKEQVNTLSTKDLRNLFKLRTGTPSDTHDKLKCDRCKIIQDNAELEALKVLPKKLAACLDLVNQMWQQDDATAFHKPLVSQEYGVTKEEYEKLVKQPMDLGTIRNRLQPSAQQATPFYKSISDVSKDVNRIFSNVLKVWSPGDEIADAARRLQSWWIEKWTELVPNLMTMKADDPKPPQEDGEDECLGERDILESCATINNERGDDYQEQIGMPDEENMRSWSHHYSTDTVDDPVFRAAMRDSDAVSFVFGLEVTWSLIQQRKQEEEERLAMKELECIREMDETDATDAAERCGEEAADEDNNGVCDQHVETPHIEDGSPGNEASDSEEVTDAGNLPEAEVVNTVSNETEIVDDVSSPSRTCDDLKVKTMKAEADWVSCTPPDCSSENKENSAPTPSPNEWECPQCTLFNKKSLRKCQACNTRKPQANKKRSFHEVKG